MGWQHHRTSGTWISRPAVLWAMDEAPDVPAHLVAALIAVARYADDSGRNAYPAVTTIAAIIRKDHRRTQRDLAALRELGLLLPGNQNITKNIRADRRPFVYDLPIPVDNPPREGPQTTPLPSTGWQKRAQRGGKNPLNGVVAGPPEEVLKTSGKGERDATAPPPLATHPEPQPLSDILSELRAELANKHAP